jgi:hypothetical protein
VVPLPPGVQLVSASCQNQELKWQVASTGSSDGTSALIAIPAEISATPLSITLSAWQPLSMNQPWQLPKLRPSGALWIAGNISVAVAPTLELQRLSTVGCQQSEVIQPVGNSNDFVSHSFAAYSANAAANISISSQKPDVTIRAVSSLALAETDVKGRLVTQVRVARGNLHQLSGDVAPGWSIEAVEANPPDSLGEWFVDRNDGRSEIEIQLNSAAEVTDDLTVIVTGRLQRTGLTQALAAETLRMVRWRDVRLEHHRLTFQTVEPYVVEPIGGLPVLKLQNAAADPPTISDASEESGPRFDLTAPAADAALRVTVKRGQYEADVWVDATVLDSELHQEFHVLARPRASHIDRLLIYSTQPLGDNLHWSERSSGIGLAAERITTGRRQQANVPQQGEAWLVRLPNPTGKPVEIVASQDLTWSVRKQLPLISVPEAVEQNGRVLVRGSVQRRPVADATELHAIPLPLPFEAMAESVQRWPVVAAYRYNPSDCLSSTDAPHLWIEPGGPTGFHGVIARRAEIESFFMLEGRAVHRVDYYLSSQGSRRLTVRLPDNATLRSLAVDGRRLVVPADGRRTEGEVGSAQSFPVSIPGETDSILTAYLETNLPKLRSGSQLQPPLLDLQVPLLAGDWTIWLPAEFSAIDTRSTPLASALHVRQRLFGPLGRPSRAPVYDPFGGDELRTMESRASIANGLASDDLGVEPATWFQEFIPPILGAEARNHTVAPDGQIRVSLAGWRARRFSFVSDRPAAVTVTRPAEMLTWSIAAFLTCAATGRSLWRRCREAFVAALATAAALALFLPDTVSPLATGAFMGLASSLLVIWPGRPRIEESPTKTWNRSASATPRMILFLAASLSPLLAEELTQAQTTTIANNDTESAHAKVEEGLNHPAIHRVLIPTDANGNPAGTKTYVGERFLRQLHLDSAPDAERRWILLGAEYQVELRERADAAEIVAGDWSMMFSVAVLARDTTIVLPLVRDEATWQAVAMVDGVPEPLVWNENGQSCSVTIEEPGRRELVVSCVPLGEVHDGRNHIRLSIPPVLGASAWVKHPEELSSANLIVSGRRLGQVVESEGEFIVELDGTERFTMNWPRVSAEAGRTPGLRVTALEWLRIGVQEIELDTKYIIEGDAPRPDSITILADARWELQRRNLPADIAPDDDGQQAIRISLPVDDVDRSEISLRWRLADAPALGRFRLPPIAPASLPEAQRWLAVSSASALKVELVNNENASAATANEFLALWGSAFGTIPPDTVLANVQLAPDLALAIEPRTAKSTVHDLLHVAAANDGLRIQYDSTVVPGGIHEFQFPIDLSRDAMVDEVKVNAAGRQIPLRWARDSEGVLSLFFSQRLTEPYQITVSGHVPVSEPGNYAIPRIGAVGNASSTRAQLYHTDDVEIELTELGSKAPASFPLEPPPSDWRGMAAGALVVDSAASPSARIVVTPNRVEADGKTHTFISRDADGWQAAFSCRLNVRNGRIDSLKLLAPSTWSGPIEIKSTVPASLESEPIDQRQTSLSVRFAKPIEAGQSLDLELQGRLATEAGSPLSVPPIVPQTELSGPHFVSVPSSADSQPMYWSETGVERTELPPDLPPLTGGDTKWATYEVVSSTFQVAQRPAAFESRTASVRLADTFVNVGPLGDQSVLTRMVVVSQGLAECSLELPNNQELLQILADGRPANVRPADILPAGVLPDGNTQWRLALGPSQLPQFIEILSRSSAQPAANASRLELSRPRLLLDGAPLPVEMSLWSFRHSASRGAATIAGADRITGAQQSASRLDRLVSISEAATSAAIEASFPDGYNWYHPWAARLLELRREVSQGAAEPSGGLALQVGSSTEEQIAQASERLDAWLETCDSALAWSEINPAQPIFDEGASATAPPMDLASGQWIHGVAEGGDPVIYVELDSLQTNLQARAATLVLVVAMAAATISLMRRPAAWDVVCQWPHAFAFLLGIAYWAFLWPSWLGIVIAVGSVLLALRSGWKGRSLQSDGSTVLRVHPR